MARALVLVLVAVLAACDRFPADPDGTTERVRGGELRVGAMHAPPFVVLTADGPTGAEAAIAAALADELEAGITWVEGGPDALLAALEDRALDLVIGGVTADTPWSEQVALTRPYLRADDAPDGKDHVLALPPGENRWLMTVERFLAESVEPAAPELAEAGL
ncbi:MAG: transporter substrate-binding domain-containing protein [Bauldia sp.]|nr:transporter substrate-binding domain-containing protein [Bauldia sp.]